MIFASAQLHLIILFVTAVVFITLGEGLFDPTYNGMLSATVSESQQGKLQGASQSLQSVYNAIIPMLVAAIYFYNRSSIYAIAAASMIIALIIFTRSNPKIDASKPYSTQ
jgi:DHA1 family tetracycline resistance protein-like MFS transporter